MSEASYWTVRETALGERPPTAGLPPRWADLVTWARGSTFENALVGRFGLSDIEITASETAALLIGLRTLKQAQPQRSTVIVPACTSPLVVIAATAAGLKVVACDTAEGSLDLDLDHLARLAGPDTLAVVATHYVGHLADVVAVRRVVGARSPDIMVIEDAGQALGGRRDGVSAGMLGDVGIYSFGVGKGLTIGTGGAFTARDPRLMRAMREEHHRVWRRDPIGGISRWARLVGYHAVYNPVGLRVVYGRPKRSALRQSDDIAAAGDRLDTDVPVLRVGGWRKRIGLAALPRLPAHLAACRARLDALARRLQSISIHTQDARLPKYLRLVPLRLLDDG